MRVRHRNVITAIGVLAYATIVLATGHDAIAQARVEKNVVFGMYSGLALLMDVYRPETPNGLGVVFVAGSGWQAPSTYDAVGLKDSQAQAWVPQLVRAGYTVFAINHRAAPRFHYPAALEDVQRAVRFVRHHAKDYGIAADRLGGVGGSSGAHLIGLTAMLGAPGLAGDDDAVNRESATLQCVVLRAAPSDMGRMLGADGMPQVVSFMELPPTVAVTPAGAPLSGPNLKVYVQASPITHVSATAPPTLLIHGDADRVVPFDQSVAMEKALAAAHVPVKLVRVPGGGHGPDFGAGDKAHPEWPDYFGETIRWLDTYLKRAR